MKEVCEKSRREGIHVISRGRPNRGPIGDQVILNEGTGKLLGLQILPEGRTVVPSDLKQFGCLAVESQDIQQHSVERRPQGVSSLSKETAQPRRSVFESVAQGFHAETHLRGGTGDAELLQQGDEVWIRLGVVNDESRVHVPPTAVDIDADGDDQRLLFGLIRIGWQALQKEHDLTISDKKLGKLVALFPLQTGGSVSFKLIDIFEERALVHKDPVKVQIDVRERTQMAFDGNTYEVWAIDTQMELSSPGAGNASTIRRRFLFSETLEIAFRVEEEMDRYAKSWEIVTHGDHVLTRID